LASLHVNSPAETRYRRIISQHNEAIYDKPTDNIILNREKMKPFFLKSGMRQGCLFSLLLFNKVLEILARSIKTRKRNKRGTNGKDRSQTVLICR
jgi:hypothetical protein